jgi:hypothetical protein
MRAKERHGWADVPRKPWLHGSTGLEKNLEWAVEVLPYA